MQRQRMNIATPAIAGILPFFQYPHNLTTASHTSPHDIFATFVSVRLDFIWSNPKDHAFSVHQNTQQRYRIPSSLHSRTKEGGKAVDPGFISMLLKAYFAFVHTKPMRNAPIIKYGDSLRDPLPMHSTRGPRILI
jgi:hypothetical protein